MKNDKLVSIIVPAYNCEKTISKCLNSIIGQDYENIEIIVINDGSTDKTTFYLNKYIKNPKIKIINKSNEGVSITRNIGIDNANGEYIIFVDSDDYIENNFVSSLINLQKYNQTSLCGCLIKRCSKNGVFNTIKQDLKYSKSYFAECLIKANIDGFIVRYLFKKELLENVRFNLDISYMEDTLFLLNYIKNSKVSNIVFTNKTNYVYMYQSENSVTNNEKFVEKNIINMCKSIDQVYLYALNNFNMSYGDILIERKAKMIEYCFSKIKSKKVFLEVKNNIEINCIYKSCIESKKLKIILKFLLFYLFHTPYFMFKLYNFNRCIIKKIKG